MVLVLTMAVAALVLLLDVTELGVPGRGLLTTLSLLTVPGVPLALALRIPDLTVQLILGVALSLAIVLLVATVQVTTGLWSPTAAHAFLLAIGTAASVPAWQRLADTRDPRPGTGRRAPARRPAGRRVAGPVR